MPTHLQEEAAQFQPKFRDKEVIMIFGPLSVWTKSNLHSGPQTCALDLLS